MEVALGPEPPDPPPRLLSFAGVDRLRFIKAVFIGETIPLERRVLTLEARDEATAMQTFEDQVLTQADALAIVFQPRYLLKRRDAVR